MFIFDLKSWLLGLSLAVSGESLVFATVEGPIAYMYNGVQLPALPYWDITKYPYAAIIEGNAEKTYYILIVCDKEFHIDNGNYYTHTNGNAMRQAVMTPGNEKSGKFGAHYRKVDTWLMIANNNTIWANFDFRDGDGNVLIAASNPVPVFAQ